MCELLHTGDVFLAEQLSPECQQSVTPARDRWFESVSLRRRVCKPSVPLETNGQPIALAVQDLGR